MSDNANPRPLNAAPQDLPAALTLESSLRLSSFTSSTAYSLGTYLYSRLQSLYPTKPAAISITLSNNNNLLFHAVSGPGITPDNDIWISRKRNTVLRFGMSSWTMRLKMGGDEDLFARKFGLEGRKGEYAIHGGGVPVRVRGVEGVVGVVVVSGLKQEEDHMLVVEGLEEIVREQQRAAGGEGR